MPRQPKGHGKTYFSDYDGKWHTWVHVGTKPNGKADRRNVRGDTAAESARRADELRDRIKRGAAVPTRIETVGQWLTFWLHHLKRDEVEYRTWRHYEAMTRNLIGQIGAWKLDGLGQRLEPEHLVACYAALSGRLARSYVRQHHGLIKQALDVAVLHGRASRNPAAMIKGPKRARPQRIKAHSLGDIQAIVGSALTDPMAERWLLGMLLGLRQGEVLAVRWSKLDLDGMPPMLTVDEQVQRHGWEHGCGDPVACVRNRERPPCRTKRCPPKHSHGCADPSACVRRAQFCPLVVVDRKACASHARACPQLCPRDCAGHATTCPKRINGGIVFKEVKSESGEREVPLFPVLAELLRERRDEQIRRGCYTHDGLVFRGPTGGPIDASHDHGEWVRLLDRAGVAPTRLHAARHTAGTLLAARADISVAQEILGHSDIRQTRQYVDVAKELKENAVNAIAAAVLDGILAALLQPGSATGSVPRGR